MPSIKLRLFGFGPKASGWDTGTREIPPGTTVAQLWSGLRSSAGEGELLARIDERHVFVLLNGRLIPVAQRQEAALEDGDEVAFMVMAIGGQAERRMALQWPRGAGEGRERR